MKNSIEQRLAVIEARNARVELDKAWETSWVRRLSIAVLTYIVVSIFLIVIHKPQPFINAFVPPIGFVLSTLVMRQVKDVWQGKMKPILAKANRKTGNTKGQAKHHG